MESSVIFPLFYLPPVELFKNLVDNKDKTLLIEKFEHYPKQTYRTRTSIYGPNGKLDLIIPLMHGKNVHQVIKDVQISYEFDWQRLHWLSLQTSYRSSAFFEFYEDDFAPFYEKKHKFLLDYNFELFSMLNKQLKLNLVVYFSTEYHKEYEIDFRKNIHPKVKNGYEPKKYFQVFEDKFDFMPNLSIVDLLFSQGPQASRFF